MARQRGAIILDADPNGPWAQKVRSAVAAAGYAVEVIEPLNLPEIGKGMYAIAVMPSDLSDVVRLHALFDAAGVQVILVVRRPASTLH